MIPKGRERGHLSGIHPPGAFPGGDQLDAGVQERARAERDRAPRDRRRVTGPRGVEVGSALGGDQSTKVATIDKAKTMNRTPPEREYDHVESGLAIAGTQVRRKIRHQLGPVTGS